MACINSVVFSGNITRDVVSRVSTKDESVYAFVTVLVETPWSFDGREGVSKVFVDMCVNGDEATRLDGTKAGTLAIVQGELTSKKDGVKDDGKDRYVMAIKPRKIQLAGAATPGEGDDANMPATVGAAKQEEMPW